MKAYECVRCGALYSVAHVNDWGRHAASDGMGTKPCCTALVETRNAVPTARGEIPRELCRGDISITEVTKAQEAAVIPARPIK